MIITAIGMAYLVVNHPLMKAQTISYSLLFLLIMAMILLIIYALRKQDRVEYFILGLLGKINGLRKREADFKKIRNSIDHFYNRLILLNNGGWAKLGLGSAVYNVLDMLTLYLFFVAAGIVIEPGVLIAGYCIAYLLGKGSFFIPGGVGVVEGGMVAIFLLLGIPRDISVVIVLAYRLVSFWIPTLLGLIAILYMQKAKRSSAVG